MAMKENYSDEFGNEPTELEWNTTYARINDIYNDFRNALIHELRNAHGYSYPSTDDGSVSGTFTQDPDFGVLKKLCEIVVKNGNTNYDGEWSEMELFNFVRNELQEYKRGDSYYIYLSFGGLSPILALLPFLAFFSAITRANVVLDRDKWETRGDYYTDTNVGVCVSDKKLIVGIFKDHNDFAGA